jgi:hypothetical protein
MAKPLKPDAIKAGEYAFAIGKSMSDNPHAPGTTDWGRWHYGWSKAQAEAAKADG